MAEYEPTKINIGQLFPLLLRDLRQPIVDQIVERIKTHGFNPSRPLVVVPKALNQYWIADGNHRYEACKILKIEHIPCVLYGKDSDPVTLAIHGNEDDMTYAPMDLFDYLSIIDRLKKEGLTQDEIGKKINFSRSNISNYFLIINKIATDFLDQCKAIQKGRVAENATSVAFDFTEGWFRDSGIYDLTSTNQLNLLTQFMEDKCQWKKAKVQQTTAKLKEWQSWEKIAEQKLADQAMIKDVQTLIYNDTFKTESQLVNKITQLNQTAANKLICGDAVIELAKLTDLSIDIVITDIPYGIHYESNYPQSKGHITRKGVNGDDLESALILLEKLCEILKQKMKPDAHLYFFSAWRIVPQFSTIIGKYFDVKNWIVWDKGNWSMGDLEGSLGNQYEMIIFATQGHKKINDRHGDIISINRVPSVKAIHPTQKPVELGKALLHISAQQSDLVCDPCMGSGSFIKAIIEYGKLNYVGIEIDPTIFEKAKSYIGE